VTRWYYIVLVGRADWWWSIIKGGRPRGQSTFSAELVIGRMNGTQIILGACCTQSMLVLGICFYLVYGCTRSMLLLGVCLYLVYAYTQCMLYSLDAVLSNTSWLWHGEIERDDLTWCCAMMVQLWNGKRDGWWRWERYWGYKWIREVSGMTYLI